MKKLVKLEVEFLGLDGEAVEFLIKGRVFVNLCLKKEKVPEDWT